MYGKLFKTVLAAALWLAGIILSAVYALFAVAVLFLGIGLVVSAFSYPPHFSSLMIIGGMIAVFAGDWMLQNPPPMFFVLSRLRLIARLG